MAAERPSRYPMPKSGIATAKSQCMDWSRRSVVQHRAGRLMEAMQHDR
jgi:hypothetical protein